jgi:hypothetical protein
MEHKVGLIRTDVTASSLYHPTLVSGVGKTSSSRISAPKLWPRDNVPVHNRFRFVIELG